MLTIDGSQGEGGGQIIRTSIGLSLVTGRRVTIRNIRAGRRTPGLRRQHLTAVAAAQTIGNATVIGAELGSSELVFEPGPPQGGNYEFDVGTAGSTSLVLQTVLPALLAAEGPSSITLSGGTHNPLAPPFDFLQLAYLPLLNRMGPTVTATLHRAGFYPAGGGSATYQITPSPQWHGLQLLRRGRIQQRRVRALVANLPRHIAERECATVAKKSGWPQSCFAVEEIGSAHGPGNVLFIELQAAEVTELFSGFGEKGVTAETVALRTYREAKRYLDADVPVGEHLADQLILPMGLAAAGGAVSRFRTQPLSQHTRTHIDVLQMFLPIHISVTEESEHQFLIEVSGNR